MEKRKYVKAGRTAKINYGGDRPKGDNLPRGGTKVTAKARVAGSLWTVEDASGALHNIDSRYLELL